MKKLTWAVVIALLGTSVLLTTRDQYLMSTLLILMTVMLLIVNQLNRLLEAAEETRKTLAHHDYQLTALNRRIGVRIRERADAVPDRRAGSRAPDRNPLMESTS